MATITGIRDSYDNTAILKRVVSDRITMAEPMEFLLLKALGINSGKFNFVNDPGSKYEWIEDTYAPTSDTAADADLDDTATLTTITVTHGEYFHVGDVIKIDDEYMWVSSISSDDLTVERAHSGDAATHASTATVYIVSQARKEGADASDSPTTEASTGYNHSFIMHKNIEVSRSNALFKRYGIANAVDREIDKGMDELMRILTTKPYYGVRDAGSGTTARDAGGFDTFITTNLTNASSARLTRKNLDDMNRTIYDAGGTADLIICGAFQQQLISDMYEGYVTTERSEQMGGVTIKRLQMALGNVVNILVDRYCPAASLWMLDTEKVGFIDIDPFFYEDLGKQGDTAAYGQIVGEYGFVVEVEDHHGKIYGLATS
jgi:hypothetical protein